MSTLYVLDTSALTWAMRDTFNIQVAPTFWVKMDEAFQNGIVLSNEMVLMEISKQDDQLFEWCEARIEFFPYIEQELLDAAATIVKAHPTMLNPLKNKDGADPFVIAQASLASATVVTFENANGPNHPHKKIPDVCNALSIPCMKPLPFLKQIGWKF